MIRKIQEISDSRKEKIKDSFEEQYQKMDDLFKDDFEEKIMIDIET